MIQQTFKIERKFDLCILLQVCSAGEFKFENIFTAGPAIDIWDARQAQSNYNTVFEDFKHSETFSFEQPSWLKSKWNTHLAE